MYFARKALYSFISDLVVRLRLSSYRSFLIVTLPVPPGIETVSSVQFSASNHTSATMTTNTLSNGSTSSERSFDQDVPIAGPCTRILYNCPSRASRYSFDSWSLGSFDPFERTMPSGRQSVMPFWRSSVSRTEKATSSPKFRDAEKGCEMTGS